MRRFLLALCLSLLPGLAQAWNAAGHRLVAAIAWQQLSSPSRQFVDVVLSRHPDHAAWTEKARSKDGLGIFIEASTWPDDIRNDPRFHDAGRQPATPPLPGLADTARHKPWHYVDLDGDGEVRAGELDRQIERLSQVLRSSKRDDQLSYALPWLLHLVADIHQPLHVGRSGDEGGNTVEIENPFNQRRPFTSLHAYWDALPGPPWLRGARLEKNALRLLAAYPAPIQGNVRLWREESHRLLGQAYPDSNGSLLPTITEDFQRQARDIANRRIVEAGYRLGELLERSLSGRVPRETP